MIDERLVVLVLGSLILVMTNWTHPLMLAAQDREATLLARLCHVNIIRFVVMLHDLSFSTLLTNTCGCM